MKTLAILGGIFLVVLVVIVASSSGRNNQDNNQQELDVSNENTPVTIENIQDNNSAESVGVYTDYDKSKLTDNKNILFFAARWCPSCRNLDQDILKNLSKIPGDLTILKVDFDSQQNLRIEYGVTMQHTLVQVDKEGRQINKWSGLYSISSLEDILKLI